MERTAVVCHVLDEYPTDAVSNKKLISRKFNVADLYTCSKEMNGVRNVQRHPRRNKARFLSFKKITVNTIEGNEVTKGNQSTIDTCPCTVRHKHHTMASVACARKSSNQTETDISPIVGKGTRTL